MEPRSLPDWKMSWPIMKQTLYSKTCVKQPLSKRHKIGFQDQLWLNASPWSILQYFWPSLSYHLSSRSLFCLTLIGCFTQVLLYQPLLKICFAVIKTFGCWVMLCNFLLLSTLFFKIIKKESCNTISVSNNLNPNQVWSLVESDLGPNYLQRFNISRHH